jgi:hypothetical protein
MYGANVATGSTPLSGPNAGRSVMWDQASSPGSQGQAFGPGPGDIQGSGTGQDPRSRQTGGLDSFVAGMDVSHLAETMTRAAEGIGKAADTLNRVAESFERVERNMGASQAGGGFNAGGGFGGMVGGGEGGPSGGGGVYFPPVPMGAGSTSPTTEDPNIGPGSVTRVKRPQLSQMDRIALDAGIGFGGALISGGFAAAGIARRTDVGIESARLSGQYLSPDIEAGMRQSAEYQEEGAMWGGVGSAVGGTFQAVGNASLIGSILSKTAAGAKGVGRFTPEGWGIPLMVAGQAIQAVSGYYNTSMQAKAQLAMSEAERTQKAKWLEGMGMGKADDYTIAPEPDEGFWGNLEHQILSTVEPPLVGPERWLNKNIFSPLGLGGNYQEIPDTMKQDKAAEDEKKRKEAIPVDQLLVASTSVAAVMGKQGDAGLKALNLGKALETYQDAGQGVSNIAAVGAMPGGAKIQQEFDTEYWWQAAQDAAKYYAASGNFQALETLKFKLSPEMQQSTLDTAYQMRDIQAQQSSLTSAASGAQAQYGVYQAQNRNYETLNPQLAATAAAQAALIPGMQQQAAAKRAAGGPGELEAQQIEAQIAGIQAQVAGAPYQQIETEFGQRGSYVASQAQTASTQAGWEFGKGGGYAGTAPFIAKEIQAAKDTETLATEKISRLTEEAKKGGYAVNRADIKAQEAIIEQARKQYNLDIPVYGRELFSSETMGGYEQTIAETRGAQSKMLYTGTGKENTAGIVGTFGTIAATQESEAVFLEAKAAGKYGPMSVPEKEQALAQAAGIRASEYSTKRAAPEFTYGLEGSVVGIEQAGVRQQMTMARLMGTPGEIAQASMGQIDPLKETMRNMQELFDHGLRTEQEKNELTSKMKDTQTEINRITITTARELASTNTQMAQTGAAITGVGVAYAHMMGMGTKEATPWVESDIAAKIAAAQSAVDERDKYPKGKPDWVTKDLAARQATIGAIQSTGERADFVVSAPVQQEKINLQAAMNIATQMQGGWGDVRGISYESMKVNKGIIDEYNSVDIEKLKKENPEAATRLMAQRSGAISDFISATNQYQFGWQDRLIQQVSNAPSSMAMVASGYSQAEAAGFLQDQSGFFGSRDQTHNQQWLHQGSRMAQSALIGPTGRPESFAATAMAAAGGGNGAQTVNVDVNVRFVNGVPVVDSITKRPVGTTGGCWSNQMGLPGPGANQGKIPTGARG